MTRPARTPAVPVDGVDEVAALLRGGGGRVSAVRQRLLDVLFAAAGPASAERLAGEVRRGGFPVDVTSVYRNLEHLEQLGVVRHMHLGHGPGLYALTRSGEQEYLVCESCGSVLGVEPERLDAVREQIRAEFGFAADFTHFPISGTCAACAADA